MLELGVTEFDRMRITKNKKRSDMRWLGAKQKNQNKLKYKSKKNPTFFKIGLSSNYKFKTDSRAF